MEVYQRCDVQNRRRRQESRGLGAVGQGLQGRGSWRRGWCHGCCALLRKDGHLGDLAGGVAPISATAEGRLEIAGAEACLHRAAPEDAEGLIAVALGAFEPAGEWLAISPHHQMVQEPGSHLLGTAATLMRRIWEKQIQILISRPSALLPSAA